MKLYCRHIPPLKTPYISSDAKYENARRAWQRIPASISDPKRSRESFELFFVILIISQHYMDIQGHIRCVSA